jgi:hypothetical protein
MPTTMMKAIRVHAPGGPEKLVHVRIKLAAAGLNFVP